MEEINIKLEKFTENDFSYFCSYPVNELFNLSILLDEIFDKKSISEVEERLAIANTDKQRIKGVEQFLLSQHKDIETDKLIVEAVKLICHSKGTIRIKELNEKLFISQSPFEKQFLTITGFFAITSLYHNQNVEPNGKNEC